MGNCNFIKFKQSLQKPEDGKISILNIKDKISKNNFNLLYAIGKGGFGRVTFNFLLRFGKLKKKVLRKSYLL